MYKHRYFQPQIASGTLVKIQNADGVTFDSFDESIGVLKGSQREIKAILCDGADASDPWYVFNRLGENGYLLDHIAVCGAVSEDQARRLSQKYFNNDQEFKTSNVAIATDQAMGMFLDSARTPSDTPYFLQCDSAILDQKLTLSSVEWDDESNQLKSHDGNISRLVSDLNACDFTGALLDQMSPKDIIQSLTCDENGMFDAMVLKYNQLDKAVARLVEALKAADTEEFFVKTVTPIAPFKRMGVVNVGFILEMSDSQTITVLFNNPDATPSKLMGTDLVTSWKWILNRRDVTAALQPRAVDSKKYPQIAKRMHMLLAKNHLRFKRAQLMRQKDELLLNELVGELEAKQLELRLLDEQLVQAQTDIDNEALVQQQAHAAQLESSKNAPQAEDEANQGGVSLGLAVGDFVTAKFANLNKNNSVQDYRDEVASGDYRTDTVIIQKVVRYSEEKYDEFVNNLLEDNSDIAGLGGTWYDDEVPREQREYLTIGTAIIAPNRETIIIDPQGYGYARYVGLDPEKIAPPEDFAHYTINPDGSVNANRDKGSDESDKAADLDSLDPLPEGFSISKVDAEDITQYELKHENIAIPIVIDQFEDGGFVASFKQFSTRSDKTDILQEAVNWGVNTLNEQVLASNNPDEDQGLNANEAKAEGAISRYDIKSNNPRARKPEGTIKVTDLGDDHLTAMISIAGVGGEYEGALEGLKSFIIHRTQGMGQAMGDGNSWDQIKARLVLTEGSDVLGVNVQQISTPSESDDLSLADKINQTLPEGFTLKQAAVGEKWELRREGVADPVIIAIDGDQYYSSKGSATSTHTDDLNNAVQWGVNLLNDEFTNQSKPQVSEKMKLKSVFKKEAEDIWRALDYRTLDLSGHTADEFKRRNVPMVYEDLFVKANALLERKFRDEYQREQVISSIANAQKTIDRWKSVQSSSSTATSKLLTEDELLNTFKPLVLDFASQKGMNIVEDSERSIKAIKHNLILRLSFDLGHIVLDSTPSVNDGLATLTTLAQVDLVNQDSVSAEILENAFGDWLSDNTLMSKTVKAVFDAKAAIGGEASQFISEVMGSFDLVDKVLRGQLAFTQEQLDQYQALVSERQTTLTEQSQYRDTRAFLENAANGKLDFSDVSIGDRLEQLADNLDPELNDLFEQAAEAYAQYAINLQP